MEARQGSANARKGVSIITCTKRRNYLGNLLQNYARQRWAKKELIVVVNADTIPLAPYLELAKKAKRVRIYRLPEHVSLGACLNFAVRQAKYDYIAKFDDDDYYAPLYVSDAVRAMEKTGADIVGKRSHYMYLNGTRTLIHRFPGDENRFVSRLPGATLFFKRAVFRNVRFPHLNVGEDDRFCLRSKKKGYKIYSAGKRHFVAIRRKNSSGHTWIVSDKELISHHRAIPNVKDYRRFAQGRKG